MEQRKKFKTALTFSEPSIYQIRVQGDVRLEWSDRLKGMQIIQELDPENGKTTSLLTGQISDQTALTGILHTLYDMRMSILSVKLLGEDKT
jgi:hypothetical protein